MMTMMKWVIGVAVEVAVQEVETKRMTRTEVEESSWRLVEEKVGNQVVITEIVMVMMKKKKKRVAVVIEKEEFVE